MLKSDSAIKEQAIIRHRQIEERRKMEIKPILGPGNICIGSIYDCNRKAFERKLKEYWDKLYIGWNPFKNEGRGCWEVWQRPSKKTTKLAYSDKSIKIYTLEYIPNDFEHWVADLDYLSYDFVDKLRKMDSWENKHQVANHDYEYDRYNEKLEEKEEEHIKYVVRHNKSVFRDLLDYTQAGYNPLDFFSKK